jgi:hypothetical protein
MLRDTMWQEDMWLDAKTQALNETGLMQGPEVCPWSMDEVRNPDFWPE